MKVVDLIEDLETEALAGGQPAAEETFDLVGEGIAAGLEAEGFHQTLGLEAEVRSRRFAVYAARRR